MGSNPAQLRKQRKQHEGGLGLQASRGEGCWAAACALSYDQGDPSIRQSRYHAVQNSPLGSCTGHGSPLGQTLSATANSGC
jgi:hypothetical protein